MPSITSDELKQQIAARPEGWYAVLDACDEPAVPEKVRELVSQEVKAACLYKGQSAQNYWAIAPYLCELDVTMLDWIDGTLAGKPWGIVIDGPPEFPAVHQHLRKLLSVRSPDGDLWYFRFYDPRVLSDFLGTADPEAEAQFFGIVTSYYTSPSPQVWDSFRRQPGAPRS